MDETHAGDPERHAGDLERHAGGREQPGADPGRQLPVERGVVPADPRRGGGAATPSYAAASNGPAATAGTPAAFAIGPRTFAWGTRTFVMGILNVTPDSFSGDGLLVGDADPVAAAVARARAMIADGADILDVGGELSRPGHAVVDARVEIARVEPVIRALRAAFPQTPISIDTVKPAVADAALAAGAHLVNDVWGVAQDDALARVAATHGVPLVVMHNRAEARYTALIAEVIADLQRAVERAVAAGVPWERLIVDPGFGFGKAPSHNLALLHDLGTLRALGRPILLGTSRKSTLGKVLDLPPDERVEATVATTAIGIAAGIDIVRVHDVRANVRGARLADAIVRGWPDQAPAGVGALGGASAPVGTSAPGEGDAGVAVPDRIELRGMRFAGRHGVLPQEHEAAQPFEVDVVLELDLRAAGSSDRLAATVDYGAVFRLVEGVVTGPHVDLIEALAERIAEGVIAGQQAVRAVVVRVRKPEAPLPGSFGWAGVEIRRTR